MQDDLCLSSNLQCSGDTGFESISRVTAACRLRSIVNRMHGLADNQQQIGAIERIIGRTFRRAIDQGCHVPGSAGGTGKRQQEPGSKTGDYAVHGLELSAGDGRVARCMLDQVIAAGNAPPVVRGVPAYSIELPHWLSV